MSGTKFTVTKMELDGRKVPISTSLSELLSQALSSKKRKLDNDLYDRRVETRNGKLVTVLTEKSERA